MHSITLLHGNFPTSNCLNIAKIQCREELKSLIYQIKYATNFPILDKFSINGKNFTFTKNQVLAKISSFKVPTISNLRQTLLPGHKLPALINFKDHCHE